MQPISNKMLSKFKIKNLFGNRDIHIDFKDSCVILVGENGLGKTTILHMLYCLLSHDYSSLLKYEFEEIEVKIKERKEKWLSFSSLVLRKFIIDRNNLKGDLGGDAEALKEIEDHFRRSCINMFEDNDILSDPVINKHRWGINTDLYADISSLLGAYRNIYELEGYIKLLHLDIIYLPTYRRIEKSESFISSSYPEDYNNFPLRKAVKTDGIQHLSSKRYDEKPPRDFLKFGMGDVRAKIDGLLQIIRNRTYLEFKSISAKTLHHILNFEKEGYEVEFDLEKVQVVINRLGNLLMEEDKTRLLNSVSSGEFKKTPFVGYYLGELYNVYKKESYIDQSLSDFCESCNKFLIGKYLLYNESNLTLNLFIKRKEQEDKAVSLDVLSSGEKQIVSILAYFYLNHKNIFMIIDEPEISISIYWQKLLLPELLKAHSCKYLIAATHSPFIYSNDLESCAIGPREYVSFRD